MSSPSHQQMIVDLFQMCILSPYDTFHWGNHDKTREEVLFKKVYLYLALAIEPWKYSSWCYFRSGIVHCASVATVVPSIPHYQVNSQRLLDHLAFILFSTMTDALSNQAFKLDNTWHSECSCAVQLFHHCPLGWRLHSMVQPFPAKIYWVTRFYIILLPRFSINNFDDLCNAEKNTAMYLS